MTILQSIILGIIQGITEFIPISSTAHLLISSKLLGILNDDFLKTFTISIQVGSILSVAVLYIKKILKNPNIILKMIVAFIPTAIIALSLYTLVKSLFMESLLIIASALIIGGIIIIILENIFINLNNNDIKLSDISYKQAFFIGIFQAIAIIPGVSRSAATIMGGLSLGLNRKTIVEFSFLLAMPTMLAATVFDLYQTPISFTNEQWTVWIIGFIISFIVAIVAIKFLLSYIKNNNFKIFGWYRIIIGSLILLWLFL